MKRGHYCFVYYYYCYNDMSNRNDEDLIMNVSFFFVCFVFAVCTQQKHISCHLCFAKIWVFMKYNVVMLNAIFGMWIITCKCFVYLMCFVLLICVMSFFCLFVFVHPFVDGCCNLTRATTKGFHIVQDIVPARI